MSISPQFRSIHTQELEISIAQCGPSSSLKYTELTNILQIVAAKHSDLGGMSFSDMQKNQQAWVSSRMRFEISDLPKWHQSVHLSTWIEGIEGMRSVRNFEILLNGTKIVGATSLWVVMNTDKRRPETLAIDHLHLTKFPDKKATTLPVNIIDLTKSSEKVAERQVQYSDLDVVNHVNNVKYLEWCLNCVERNIMDTKKIKAFEVNFIKELTYQDSFIIEKAIENTDQYYYIKKDNKICFALKIEL